MTNVVIVVEDGRVTAVYSQNKNINIELLDLDSDWDCEGIIQMQKRINAIENSKTYRDIYRR